MKVWWLVVTIFVGTTVAAQEQEKVRVLEAPRYDLKGRFTLDGGISLLPLDAFRKPLQFDLGLSYQFSELWTWEIASVAVTLVNFDTGLKNKIEREGSTASTVVNVDEGSIKDLSLRVSSRGYLNLLYSKSNWFNRSIVYHQWQVGGGVSYFHMDDDPQVTVDLNFRVRFFLSDRWTFNFSGGHSIGVMPEPPRNIMNVGFGVGYAF